MAAAFKPDSDLDIRGARERVGTALRQAWEGVEESPLEDETQRLMLHLAIEPYERDVSASSAEPRPRRRRRSILRRLLRRRGSPIRA